MPINESTRKRRERWPVEFDIEGVPRDSTIRQQLLEAKQKQFRQEQEQQEMPVNQVKNFFAVDQPQPPQVIDINNPPVARYGTPQNPRKAYPKIVYNHDTGMVLQVKNAAQHEAAKKRDFQDKPSEKHDYHNVISGQKAKLKQEGPEREKLMTAEELEAIEAQELNALNEAQNQQSAEEAEAEIAAQLGEPAKTKRKK